MHLARAVTPLNNSDFLGGERDTLPSLRIVKALILNPAVRIATRTKFGKQFGIRIDRCCHGVRGPAFEESFSAGDSSCRSESERRRCRVSGPPTGGSEPAEGVVLGGDALK